MSQTKGRPVDSEDVENIQKIDIVMLCIDFLRVFRRMWLRVVLLGVVAAVLAVFFADRQYQAFYTASATFTINLRQEQQDGTSTSFLDNVAAEQMATSFPYILMSGVLQRKVASALGVSAMPGSLDASVIENTNLLTISVTDVEPERAYNTLQAVVENYPSVSEMIVGKINMKMLDETGVPAAPDNSKNLVQSAEKGAIVGVTLGLGWVVLVMLARKTIRREEDCPRYVNQRCLGSVPLVRFKERSKKTENRINITDESISHEFKESIRLVRNKVERHAKDNGVKMILITSALAGEGKSTIAVNLAISMAQEGKKVALVDCDLRNPSDNEILKIEAKYGLIDYLTKKVKFNECLYTASMLGIKDKIKLLFIPGGEAVEDGATLLGSDSMKRVFDSLKEKVDYVILDSAPVGLLTDASVLAQYADGAVFVVKKDFAKADHILNGMEHLAESNIHMIGCVLNGD